jgi:hypothetical protein
MIHGFAVLNRGVSGPVVVVIMKYLDYHHGLIGYLRQQPRAGFDPRDRGAVEATSESERSERHGRSGIHGGKAQTRPCNR